MLDNNVQDENLTDDNNKKLLSSEDNGVQDLSNTNSIGNNEQVNASKQNTKDDANSNDHLFKTIDLIKKSQEYLIAQIKDIQEKEELIIERISELSKDINDLKKSLPNIYQKTVNTKHGQSTRSNKYEPSIIPVKYLQEHGKDKLYNELEIMTDDELKQMNKLFLKKTKKELEKIDRKTMLEDLVKYAETELNRGSKFLEDR